MSLLPEREATARGAAERRRKIVFIGNYLPDAQQSMLRFGDVIEREMAGRGWETETLRPRARVTARLSWLASGSRLGKWLGYVDKYLLFPRALAAELRGGAGRGAALIHVVDHSNALYLPKRPTAPWVVTCHDLLAVRGALGEATDCPASRLGRRLQRRIVRGLSRASAVACDSSSTLGDLQRLVAPRGPQLRRTILLGQNRSWRPAPADEAMARLRPLGCPPRDRPFLLHVGSNLTRKNKAGIIRVLKRLRDRWAGHVCFAGAELTEELRRQALAAGLEGRIFALPRPDDAQLEALYSLAHALIYPSTCEGFGWPVIEAQACGCPVICSDRTSLPEVAGDAALIHDIADEAGMASSVLWLSQAPFRSEFVRRGMINVQRFAVERMAEDYAALYEEVLAPS